MFRAVAPPPTHAIPWPRRNRLPFSLSIKFEKTYACPAQHFTGSKSSDVFTCVCVYCVKEGECVSHVNANNYHNYVPHPSFL